MSRSFLPFLIGAIGASFIYPISYQRHVCA
jgi:hypothetical protein